MSVVATRFLETAFTASEWKPVASATGKIRVVVVLPRPAVLRAVESFAARRMLDVAAFATMGELLANPEWSTPQVLVLPTGLPPPTIADLERFLDNAQRVGPRPHVLLFSLRDETSGFKALATRLKAKLIAGKFRLLARVVEALAEATGVEPRIHVPADATARASLAQLGSSAVPVVLENISAGGAKVLAPFEPAIDGRYFFSAQLTGGETLETWAHAVRAYSDASGNRWHIGLKFAEAVPAEQLDGLGGLPPGVVRGKPRFPQSPRVPIKVRVTPRGSNRRLYLSVLDISESGLRAVARFDTGLNDLGSIWDAQLMWPGCSLRCRCELVRSEKSMIEEGAEWQVGLKFTEVPRTSRKTLRALLARLENQGVAAVSSRFGNRVHSSSSNVADLLAAPSRDI